MCYMLKTYKRCTLQVPHEPFYLRNTCSATFSAHFPHVFHNVSMHFECGNNTYPFINVICVKKTNPSILPSLRCQPDDHNVKHPISIGFVQTMATKCYGRVGTWFRPAFPKEPD